MHIFIENVLGKTDLPLENGKHTLSLYSNCIVVQSNADEEIRVICSDTEYIISGESEYRIPIVWQKDNKCHYTIKTKNGYAKYLFELDDVCEISDEDILNLYKFVEQIDSTFMVGKSYRISDLYSAITENEVSLIIEKTPYVGYDDQSLLSRIRETVPMIMDICSHPKQSLKSEEAVLEVSLVKRINSRTMDHLASHSEHWKSRTLNGLIPNRLKADIFEDEINIYENLFFRMAVNDILTYIHRQAVSIEKTIQQNDNAIDWNAYGNTLFDYKRMRIFEQLLPDYDVNEKREVNSKLEELLKQWEKLERNYSTIEASQFYRSIDRKRHISRNINMTNILKKDSRYNALYRLWCEIQHQIAVEHRESANISGNSNICLSDGYSLYVITLLLYAFKLLECNVESNSAFELKEDGSIEINAMFNDEHMIYHVTSERNKFGLIEIKIRYIEKIDFTYSFPEGIRIHADEVKSVLPESSEIGSDGKSIVFHSRPKPEEIRALKNVFHLSNSEKKNMDKGEKKRLDDADKVWRPSLDQYFASGIIRNPRTDELVINPQFASIASNENAVERYTRSEFNGVSGKTMFALPVDITGYRSVIKDDKLVNRLLNYGEKYIDEDAPLWGDYKVGMLPISQSEINSAQRLMKVISIHSSKLQIRWRGERAICPICGSSECNEESRDSWKCNNPECGVLFGITRHDKEKGGCGETYEWVRPYVSIKNKDVQASDYMDLMLKKELIFDRLAITDFDLKKQSDGSIRYIPICPKCGKR